VDVLAVRASALQTYGPALRELLAGHFAAQTMLRESATRAAALMAARLQTPAAEVAALYRGLRLPDRAQNAAMLAPGGAIDRTARELQQVMVQAGLLPSTSVQQVLADPRFLPV
jgi:hypothetical protein